MFSTSEISQIRKQLESRESSRIQYKLYATLGGLIVTTEISRTYGSVESAFLITRDSLAETFSVSSFADSGEFNTVSACLTFISTKMISAQSILVKLSNI